MEQEDLRGSAVYLTPDIGQPRADIAAVKLGLLNLDVLIEPYPVPIEGANAEAIVMGATVVLDCSGDEEIRLAVNYACCAQGIPLVAGGSGPLEGCFMVIVPGRSACWCCLADRAPQLAPGSVGPLDGAIGSMQALAALRIIEGSAALHPGQLVRLDAHTLEQVAGMIERQPDCAACAEVAAAPQSGD